MRRGLTKKQKAELAIVDNRASELAEWNLDALKESDADLEKFFTTTELDALEDREAKVRELEIKPPPTMAWVLLGIPLDSFGKVQKHLKALEARADLIVKATRDREDGQPQPAPED